MADYFLTFEVMGHPEPAGSKKAIPTRPGWQRIPGVRWKVVDDNDKAKAWKRLVASTARGAMLKDRLEPFQGGLFVQMTFIRRRPESHLRKDGGLTLEGHRNPHPTKKPDVLKLARAVEDAMTGVVYRDDSQITSERLLKQWGEQEGVHIVVMPL